MKTVLTVDDSKVVRTMVARALKAFDCRVVEAQNGKEGVEVAREETPDLILLDVTMPVMDGREALRELRAQAETAETPVVMLTAESGKDIVVEVAQLGVSGYIIKPFKQEGFESEVSKVLGEPGAADAGGPVDPKAVLVIDDSEKVLEAARNVLEESMTVLTALSGAEAIESYRNSRPGVVVCDLAMPEMDGFATITELQRLGRSGYVALAVRGEDGVREKARKAGYHGVVDKPFQSGELIEEVLAAASSVVPPEELLQCCIGEVDGCPVFSLPRSRLLVRLLPEFTRKLRALAESGNSGLIIDLGQVDEIGADQVTALARMISDAEAVGIRPVLCTPSPAVVESLREIAETRDAPCVDSREAARASL